MAVSFLVHHSEDNVGVAVQDMAPGEASGGFREGGSDFALPVLGQVPLGHKVALKEVPEGGDVIEYGVIIGVATAAIRRGEHVHVHNLKGRRWSR